MYEGMRANLPVVNEFKFSGGERTEDGFILLKPEDNEFRLDISLSNLGYISQNGYCQIFFDLICKPITDVVGRIDFVDTKIIEINRQLDQKKYEFQIPFKVEGSFVSKFMDDINNIYRHYHYIPMDHFYIEARYTHKHQGEMGISESLHVGKFFEINAPLKLDIKG